jgi:hypothetical protein
LQAWWVISELPPDLYKEFRLTAGLGPWLPMHLTPTYKLMQAVRNSGIKTHVVVASFPDAVCPVLGKVGLTPTVGLGNLDNFIPELKKVTGEKLGIPMRDISIYMIGHHVLRTITKLGDIEKVPYYLRIFVGNKDVTGEFDLNQLVVDAANLVVKSPGHSKVAASGEEHQKYDGIEKIEDDGTVVHTEKAVKFMKETLGYDCSRVKIEENEEKAKELGYLYREFTAKFKK